MKNVFSSSKVKTFKKQIQLVTTWVLPPFQTIQSHGGIPCFPARRAAPGRQALLLVLVTHQGPPRAPTLGAWPPEQERDSHSVAGHQFPPLLAVGPCSPRGFLRVALLGSLSWKCSPLIAHCVQTFPHWGPAFMPLLPWSLPRPPSLQAVYSFLLEPLEHLPILRTRVFPWLHFLNCLLPLPLPRMLPGLVPCK